MYKIIALIFALALPFIAAGQAVMDLAGGTNGTLLSGTNLNSSSHCFGSASWTGDLITTTAYSNAHALPFAATKYCGGTGYAGSSALSVKWAATGDHWQFTNGGDLGQKVSVNFSFYLENPTATFSLNDSVTIANTGESIVFAPHAGAAGVYFISIEKSFPTSTTYWGTIRVNANTWYNVTCLWDNTIPIRSCAIYLPGSLTPLPDLGSTGPFGFNPGGTNYMNNIPATDTTHHVVSVKFGNGGSQDTGFMPTYFGNVLVDFSGTQYPLLDGGYWSGLINGPRTSDWTQVGVNGNQTIPSASWLKCGATVPAGSSAATITAAIAACGTNQFVLLAPGTYNLTSGIDFAGKSNVVLRGSGANSTFLVYGAGATLTCINGGSGICIKAADTTFFNPEPSTYYEVTGGYAQGSENIHIGNSASCTVSTLSCPITTNQTVLVMEQCEDGFSGDTCATGSAGTDNGNYFNESVIYNATGPVGASFDGPDSGNGTALRFQMEMFQATATDATHGTLTLSHPLRNPNWRSSQTPHIWRFTPLQNSGVENLSMDFTADSTPFSAIGLTRAANVWVKGVRIVNEPFHGIYCLMCFHYQFEQNYLFSTNATNNAPGQIPHAVNVTMGGDGLVQNNIFHAITTPLHEEGSTNGTVIAYNYCVNDFFPSDNMKESARPHSNGDNYILFEGNACPNIYIDDTHGTELTNTMYRNFLPGWESCGSGSVVCGSQTAKGYHANPIILSAYSRYQNVFANVLGTINFHTAYQSIAPTNGGANNRIYVLGEGGGGVPTPGDSIVSTMLTRYGNYDTISLTNRWCANSSSTGWATTCSSTSEVSTGVAVLPAIIPSLGDTGIGQGPLPTSLYLSAKPAWFQSLTWPSIGPDVTSGNVGQCSGTLNVVGRFNGLPSLSNALCGGFGITASAWGGHVNAIPPMFCYLGIMGGNPDGTSSALPFDATNCYATLPAPIATFTPPSVNFGQVPAGLTSNPIPVTLQNTGTANLSVSTVSLGSAVFSLINNTCGSPATITNTIPGTGFTLTPGASCTFQAIYQPVVPNFTNTASVFFSPGASNPDALSLTGNSTGPSAPSIINFAGNFISSGTVAMK